MKIVAIVALALVYASFLAGFGYLTVRMTAKKAARRRFFIALNSIVQQKSSIEEQLSQVNLNFKKLAESNRYVSSELRGPEDLIELFIHLLDTGQERYIMGLGIKPAEGARDGALALLLKMRERNPFSTLPSREANVLVALDQAVETNNIYLSKNLIRQIAQEIEVTHNNLRTQMSRNRIAYTISTVGLVLTTFFGILSLLLGSGKLF